jgi:hypothetical protein
MQFSPDDMDSILSAVGESIQITDGLAVKTITGKFRKNFQSVSPYETTVGILLPAFTCKTADMAGVSNAAVFRIQSVDYKLDGKPEEQPSGFTLVKLGLKK